MKKKIGAAILLLGMATNASAGVVALTWHSRANCGGFNESITWHLGHNNLLRTVSDHDNQWNDRLDEGLADPPGVIRDPELAYRNTWRSAAFHHNEAYWDNEYIVHGWHWAKSAPGRRAYQLGETWAYDCNLYNGWWDYSGVSK